MIPECTNQTHTTTARNVCACGRVTGAEEGTATTEPLVESCPITTEAELSDGQTAQWAVMGGGAVGRVPGPAARRRRAGDSLPWWRRRSQEPGRGSGCLTDRGGARSSSPVRAPSQDLRVPGWGWGRREARGPTSGGEGIGTPRAHRLFRRGGVGTCGVCKVLDVRDPYRGQPASEPGEGRAGRIGFCGGVSEPAQ